MRKIEDLMFRFTKPKRDGSFKITKLAATEFNWLMCQLVHTGHYDDKIEMLMNEVMQPGYFNIEQPLIKAITEEIEGVPTVGDARKCGVYIQQAYTDDVIIKHQHPIAFPRSIVSNRIMMSQKLKAYIDLIDAHN